jgi:hypothetical protein|tara:strand:+ start:85 stop:579 length:495 start_codon:yes stop_codon:yes gene_type:complete
MKLQLKAIKHTEWASEETHCYQASLYIDGKPVAIVSNDGHGGCDRDYAHPKFKGDYRATMKAVHEYFKSLPNTDACNLFPDGMAQQLEYWCGDQVNQWLSERELKRKMKSYVLIQLLSKEGIYQTKYHPTTTKGEWVINKQAGETRRILNDMPFDEALAIWKTT